MTNEEKEELLSLVNGLRQALETFRQWFEDRIKKIESLSRLTSESEKK